MEIFFRITIQMLLWMSPETFMVRQSLPVLEYFLTIEYSERDNLEVQRCRCSIHTNTCSSEVQNTNTHTKKKTEKQNNKNEQSWGANAATFFAEIRHQLHFRVASFCVCMLHLLLMTTAFCLCCICTLFCLLFCTSVPLYHCLSNESHSETCGTSHATDLKHTCIVEAVLTC